jgi:hypothetical protein
MPRLPNNKRLLRPARGFDHHKTVPPGLTKEALLQALEDAGTPFERRSSSSWPQPLIAYQDPGELRFWERRNGNVSLTEEQAAEGRRIGCCPVAGSKDLGPHPALWSRKDG